MFIKNKLPFNIFLDYSLKFFILVTAWSTLIVAAYVFLGWKSIAIPFLPLALIGTAVAFYLGFKNNSSYDRLWEARTIWGGIVNDSRSWTAMINSYVNNVVKKDISNEKLYNLRKDIINRHIAWLYAHKFSLRNKKMDWEHHTEHNNTYRTRFQEHFSISTNIEIDLKRYLSQDEIAKILKTSNPAIQLLNNQSVALTRLRENNIIEDFRLFELHNHLNKFIENQGRNERIKNFPYPRQFALICNFFVNLFVFLLPFGLLSEMSKLGDYFIWLNVPFSVLIAWVFFLMNVVGDYSENPFEGLINDVPITSMVRNIEIDMLQMCGEENIPDPIMPRDGVLM